MACCSSFEVLAVCVTYAAFSAADPSSESKEDQWMGVTVQSQGPGGKVVVSIERCVHSALSACCVLVLGL